MSSISFSSPSTNKAALLPNTTRFRSRHNAKPCLVEAVAVAHQNSATLNLYETLKVERTASLKEIKSAYRKLAKVVHPDRANDGGRYFIEIHNAYETLSDPQSRAMYDLSAGIRLPVGSCSGGGGFNRTQRWETDQCW
ncbi:Chaperone protein dnaJ 11, chloroplastic [Linum grandiflorum]